MTLLARSDLSGNSILGKRTRIPVLVSSGFPIFTLIYYLEAYTEQSELRFYYVQCRLQVFLHAAHFCLPPPSASLVIIISINVIVDTR